MYISVDLIRAQAGVLVDVVPLFKLQPTLPILDRLHRILDVFVSHDPVCTEQQGRHQEVRKRLVQLPGSSSFIKQSLRIASARCAAQSSEARFKPAGTTISALSVETPFCICRSTRIVSVISTVSYIRYFHPAPPERGRLSTKLGDLFHLDERTKVQNYVALRIPPLLAAACNFKRRRQSLRRLHPHLPGNVERPFSLNRGRDTRLVRRLRVQACWSEPYSHPRHRQR